MAIRKKKVKNATSRKNGLKMTALKCVFCKELVKADATIRAVLCSRCTARLAGTPIEIGKFPKDTSKPKVKKVKVKKVVKKKVRKVVKKKGAVSKPASKTSGWGRGWHLKKKFVAPTGEVFKFGELVKKK
jgi:hypothetical protein